ncbi:Putative nickel insertion protein [Geodia barretti]|uniref:Nickel insertion protein n=1 Tax=Geodia barretti TaxID=519541 RepID=A0AA35R930_GEOBA|nr:Putative nickel insertion protein [Geodia barretti]
MDNMAQGSACALVIWDNSLRPSHHDLWPRWVSSESDLRVPSRPQRGVLGTFVHVELDEQARKTHQFDDFIETVRVFVHSRPLRGSPFRRSTAIFRRMAEAEARVHRTTVDHLHLHELGTLDTLIDVVGSVAGLEHLGVERVFASPFPMGTGVFRSAHGVLPVPSPATSALFTMADAPIVQAPGNPVRTGEMVTPTVAGIITTLAEFRQPTMAMQAHGYGLGSRDPKEYPNVLGLWVGEILEGSTTGGLSLLETNLDDSTGEVLGYVHERLFELGARDVWFTPIQMKKNRPATMLCAIVDELMRNRPSTWSCVKRPRLA